MLDTGAALSTIVHSVDNTYLLTLRGEIMEFFEFRSTFNIRTKWSLTNFLKKYPGRFDSTVNAIGILLVEKKAKLHETD